MSWWDIVLGKVNVGNVLNTPGKGMEALNARIFTIGQKNSTIMYVRSGKSTIPLEKKRFDTIEEAFQQNPKLYLFVAALRDVPALPGSADELIRKAMGSELATGNYVCSMLEHCGLVKYEMRGTKKVIVLPKMS
jgi:hypothetical protein